MLRLRISNPSERHGDKYLASLNSWKTKYAPLCYSILPDKALEYSLAELKRINKTVMER